MSRATVLMLFAAAVYALSLYNSLFMPLLLLSLVLFRDELVLLAARAIAKSSVSPPIAVKHDYCYDVKNRIIHVFYKVEPLHDVSQMTAEQHVGLVQEIVRRLNLDPQGFVTFVVKGSDKYVRVSHRAPTLHDFERLKPWFRSVEDVLKSYFVVRRLEGSELRGLLEFRALSCRPLAIPAAILSLIHLVLFKVPGLIVFAALLGFTVYSMRRLDVGICRSDVFSYRYYSSKITLLFSRASDHDLRSLALSTLRRLDSYALVISADPELLVLSSKMTGKYGEKVAVHERLSAYARLREWQNVVDRMAQGETPIKMLILTQDRHDLPCVKLSSLLPSTYLFWCPYLSFQHALSRDAAVFMPLAGGKLEASESRARIALGEDDVGKKVVLDVDALPSSHGLIIGPTGMGKSWTAMSIVYKLVRSGIKCIIIDPHGEYLRIPGVEPIDVTEQFINIFDLNGLTAEERISRIARSICFAIGRDEYYHLVVNDLMSVYKSGSFRDFHKAFRALIEVADHDFLRNEYMRLYSFFRNVKVVSVSDLLDNKALVFRKIMASSDAVRFAMLQLVDHVYSYVIRQRVTERVKYVLVVDEAYYIMGLPIMELYVRGLRKFGLATVLITQPPITSIIRDILQNLGFMIVLGGSRGYASEVVDYLQLSQEDLSWLSTALPPHLQGVKAKAILITPPIARKVLIDLVRELKR